MPVRKPGKQVRRRRQYDSPDVEVEKLDAEEFLSGELEKKPSPEEDLMANAVPIEAPKEVKAEPPRGAEVKAPKVELPPPEAEAPLDRILSDSLIDRLNARFGIVKEKTATVTLNINGKPIEITFRKPTYDDLLWALGEIEARITNGIDVTLLVSDHGKRRYLRHLQICRAVLQIEGEYVWDAYELSADASKLNPSWDGVAESGVHDAIRAEAAVRTHNLFKSLHEDILFDLSNEIDKAFPEEMEQDSRESGETTEDPS